ncbi:MAG: YiiX/YebB-like N1pC/P60 family cysteine hydrolase [Bacteroidales bacterium]|jgi:hypothetical protein|nr:YiiX/YebB-like N1pC/P60 family cysteine hydrolase [Bacteroidales bacterium]
MKFKQITYLLLITLVISCTNKQNDFELQEGDIVFQDLDCGKLCDAIEKVTSGINNTDLSHIGIIIKSENDKLVVLEAIGERVHQTAIDTFLNRNSDEQGKPKVIVGRLKPQYKKLTPLAIEYAKELTNEPYDNVFDISNKSYYCSELIYYAFKKANNNIAFFKLFPMTFIDPETNKTFHTWIDYYANLNCEIPEGKPGLNPGSISRSDKIEIVHQYYKTQK